MSENQVDIAYVWEVSYESLIMPVNGEFWIKESKFYLDHKRAREVFDSLMNEAFELPPYVRNPRLKRRELFK
jgi:hypothetical protein